VGVLATVIAVVSLLAPAPIAGQAQTAAGLAEVGKPATHPPAQAQQLPARTFSPGGLGLELVWKKTLGSGYSRIAVADGRVVTMFSDGEFDHLVALDVATGEEIWRYQIATTYRGHDGSQDGPISTPVVDAGVVYGLGPKGHLFAVALADGQPIWSTQIAQEVGARPPYWGFATTPLIDEDVLVVQRGGTGGRSVTGFRKQTGQILWAVGDDSVGYQSPAVGTLAGQRQVVAVGNHLMMGIRPRTGEILWSYQHGVRGGEGSEEPVFIGEDQLLIRFYGDGGGRHGESDAALYQINKTEAGFAVEEIWRAATLRRSWAIPVLHDGYLYGFDGSFLTCVDLTTGELVWKSRPPGSGGLRLLDGHLVTFSYQGVVAVAEATPVGYREKARLPIADHGSYQAPKVTEGRIFVRNFTEIASLRVIDTGAGARLTADASASPLMNGDFGTFVRRVQAAAADEKASLINEFFDVHDQFPIIEGDRVVHFVYRGEVDDVALYGSTADAESGAPMTRIPGTDFHYASYGAEPNTRWEYWFRLNFDQVVPDPLNPRRRQTRGWNPGGSSFPVEAPAASHR
jgi:outer membrane protein assembly factor BamB